jgi:hypothetical protein
MPAIPAFWRLRQEDLKLRTAGLRIQSQANLGHHSKILMQNKTFLFSVLGLVLRAYTLSHSTSSFL